MNFLISTITRKFSTFSQFFSFGQFLFKRRYFVAAASYGAPDAKKSNSFDLLKFEFSPSRVATFSLRGIERLQTAVLFPCQDKVLKRDATLVSSNKFVFVMVQLWSSFLVV